MTIDGNRPAHNRGIGIEAIAPQSIGENDLVGVPVSAIVAIRRKKPTPLRPEAEELKVVRGDKADRHGLRLRIRLVEVDRCLREGDGILPGMPRFAHKQIVVIVYGVAVVPQDRRVDKVKLAGCGNMRPRIV